MTVKDKLLYGPSVKRMEPFGVAQPCCLVMRFITANQAMDSNGPKLSSSLLKSTCKVASLFTKKRILPASQINNEIFPKTLLAGP